MSHMGAVRLQGIGTVDVLISLIYLVLLTTSDVSRLLRRLSQTATSC